jgi:hypothetical protein
VTWAPTAPPQGYRFYAVAPNRACAVILTVAREPNGREVPHSIFVQSAVASARQFYLTRDPKAAIRYRNLALPGGRSVEVISRSRYRSGGKTTVYVAYSYGFQHGGNAYDFTFTVAASQLSAFLPIIKDAAHSIRFT